MKKTKVSSLVTAALLCAIGIIIPMFSPVRLVIEPASFTLASHVTIFIAMFISPYTAVAVALGTTVGFFLGGFPIIVVLRAFSHVIFATAGAMTLQERPLLMSSWIKAAIFSFVLALIHATCEIVVVTPFYFSNTMSATDYSKGFITSIMLLVGLGTIIHSMIDFWLAQIVWKSVKHQFKPSSNKFSYQKPTRKN